MNALKLLEHLDGAPITLGNRISCSDNDEFEKQFRKICSSSEGRTRRGIVYVWSTKDTFPRFKGRSDVLYIGKTTQTFFERHHRYAELEASSLNWERYKHAMQEFGPISLRCAEVDEPRKEEKRLLEIYFREHLEYPPLNRLP